MSAVASGSTKVHVSSYRPTRNRSPGTSTRRVTRASFTYVPLVLPRSVITSWLSTISNRACRRETSRSSSTTAATAPSRPTVAGSTHTRSLVCRVCRSVRISRSSGMVDHRTAQIGPGQGAHEGTVVDHGKPADPAVDHHDRRPGELVGRPNRRHVAYDKRVDDA